MRTGTTAAIALDTEQEQYVVATVCDIVRSTLPADSPFADSKSDERALHTSIGYPMFRLFRCMYEFEDKLKKPMAQLLRQIFRKLELPCGHLMLYYLKVTTKLQTRKANASLAAAGGGVAGAGGATDADSITNSAASPTNAIGSRVSPANMTSHNSNNSMASSGGGGSSSNTSTSSSIADSSSAAASSGGFKTSVYRQLCDYLDDELDACLARDLTELEAASGPVFLWLLPDVVREFKPILLNNSAMLRVLCGCVDARGLRDLIYSVTQGKLTLFKNEGVLRCVRESLVYETFEQYCLWQLVLAHDVPIEYLQVSVCVDWSPNHRRRMSNNRNIIFCRIFCPIWSRPIMPRHLLICC